MLASKSTSNASSYLIRQARLEKLIIYTNIDSARLEIKILQILHYSVAVEVVQLLLSLRVRRGVKCRLRMHRPEH
jgi:hypothetical protein